MITLALQRIRPGAWWALNGTNYSDLQWFDTEQTIPSEAEIHQTIEVIRQEQAAIAYQRLRAVEYPPVTEYIDGVVKGDQEQVQAYIDACLAVKAKYPKPE